MSTYVQLGRVEAGLPPALVDDEDVTSDRMVYVRRIVPGSAGHVWQVLLSPQGTAVWLGHGAVIAGPGQTYMSDEGDAGVVRSFHPLEQLRLSWHSSAEDETSLVELDLTPVAGHPAATVHEGLPSALRSAMQERWEQRLDDFARSCL